LALLLEVLVISLISDFLLLHLSDFLDFIEVGIQLLSIESLLMDVLFSLSSIIWVLETNESVYCLAFFAEDFNALDFSVSCKVVSKLLFSSIRREVFDVEIASFL
jgi:hypothetical protein